MNGHILGPPEDGLGKERSPGHEGVRGGVSITADFLYRGLAKLEQARKAPKGTKAGGGPLAKQ